MSLCLLFLIILTGVCFSTIFLIEKLPEDKDPKILKTNEWETNASHVSEMENQTGITGSNNYQNSPLENGKIGQQKLASNIKKSVQSTSSPSVG